MVLATAVFKYFPSQIAVVGAGFAGFDCHQATEIRQNRQYHQRLLPILLSLQKNQSWNGSRNRTCCFVYCQFMLTQQSKFQKADMNCRPGSQPTVHVRHFLFCTATPVVAKARSEICTVDQVHSRQFMRDISCFVLPPQQS